MASGVKVGKDVEKQFDEMKLGHTSSFILMGINNGAIEVMKNAKKGEEGTSYEEFVADLPQDDCRYAVYDLGYTLKDGREQEKLVFIAWCPDTAHVKKKMIYASSKDALVKKLKGVSQQLIQASDYSDLEYKSVVEKVSMSK
ncbi:unnamed protein product [Owenia fusiformis]|uniref:Uncharacterized protein n=1 Tax=Owenia fusiformis TaxID=6347 RepID=A0A8J1T5J2_OWEFU|nr:unnamed protein product [Owenia fusiformis]